MTKFLTRRMIFGVWVSLCASFPSTVSYASPPTFGTPGVLRRDTVPLSRLIPPQVQRSISARKNSADAPFSALEALPADIAESVDLRSRDTFVKQQPGPYCSTFGLLSAMENVLGGKTDLSWRHGWSKYRQYNSEAAVAAFSISGVVETSFWPDSKKRGYRGYQDQNWYRLTQSDFLQDSIPLTLRALNQGHPVYLALSTPAELYACEETISPTTPLLANSGHAIAIVGYKLDPTEGAEGGHFLIKNSWGENCGDHGYQWIPFNFCRRSDAYCMMWEISGVSTD